MANVAKQINQTANNNNEEAKEDEKNQQHMYKYIYKEICCVCLD